MAIDPRNRILSRVDIVLDTGCWEWRGYIMPEGYGLFSVARRQDLAHRWSYRIFVGEIPSGFDIDHLCRNRRCVNPLHLEAVTRRENCRRGDCGIATGEQQAAKSYCRNGHPFDEANTRRDGRGHRVCRACMREHQRAYAERKRATNAS